MLQARLSSSRCQHQQHVQHSRAVCVRASPACRPAQTQSVSAGKNPAQGLGSACGAAVVGITACCSRSTASVVCRDAPRPMWAAKQPTEAPKEAGGAMARLITRDIADFQSVVALSDIYNEWGGSFDYIHASAALVKCGKLPGGGRSSLVDKLCSTWLSQLSMPSLQQYTNVLWASVRLGPGAVQRLCGPTWDVFVECLQRDSSVEGACIAQNVANPLWACAKLRKQPSVGELQLLVQTFLQPAVMADANSQAVANVVWALGELCVLPGWQGGVSEQDMQQLLGKQQLQVLAAGESGQEAANVLLGLANMASGPAPVLSVSFARDCSKQLLAVAGDIILSSTSQQIANSMWACGRLGLADAPFVAAAVAAAPQWVPASNAMHVAQAPLACAVLHRRDEAFMQVLLQKVRALVLQEQQHHGRQAGSRHLETSTGGANSCMAAWCYAVARLEMVQLADAAVSLVVSSGIGTQQRALPANLRRLWLFHSWLVEKQLLDGRGLTGVLTKRQLQQGAQEAAVYGDG